MSIVYYVARASLRTRYSSESVTLGRAGVVRLCMHFRPTAERKSEGSGIGLDVLHPIGRPCASLVRFKK